MILKATVAGQEESTRATMDGDSVGSTNWKFDFDSNDQVSVSNNTINNYYTFTKSTKDFVSTEARTTATAADWYAYFPSNDVSLTNQDGSFEKVANYYAMAGKDTTATTGVDGLDITMNPQVAILRVVKVEKPKYTCDINVRTADGKYITGLTAKKNEAGFDIKTSDTKVTYFSQTKPGVYYIAVPAGVQLFIYNGDNYLRNKTKEAGLTAGKYYTVLTDSTTGRTEAIINGERVWKSWVQLYPGGEKIATENVDHQLTWTEAAKTGKDYVWGKNWRTPTTKEMDIVNSNKIGKTTGVENGKPGFIFYGTHLGYSKEKNYIFLPANDKSVESYMEGNYWSSELVSGDNSKGQCLDMQGGSGYFVGGGWAKIKIDATNYVRPIIND